MAARSYGQTLRRPGLQAFLWTQLLGAFNDNVCKIEEAINGILGDMCPAVTAVPEAARAERLVAFYTRADVFADDLWERLCQTELPRLWLPKREHLIHVPEIPTLGTGKVDLRGLRQLGLNRSGESHG